MNIMDSAPALAPMDKKNAISPSERDDFRSLFPQILKDITESEEYQDMPETNKWFANVLDYNVPHGKLNRGLATALAFKYFTPAETRRAEDVRLSYILGWSVEIMQAYFLVADDIMDDSETRRGRPCWYKVDNLGATAFNDAIFLESTVYILLRKYFRKKDYYADILDVMHDINHKAIYGESLDIRTGIEREMSKFTMDRYSAIVKYKTSYYSFYLPVRLGMAMSGIGVTEGRILQQVRTITLKIGEFFQVQDDFLDCFGDTEQTGKVGSDIKECKCSWLFIKAVEQCSEEQKQLLYENYGRSDPEKVNRVKKLYIELGLQKIYSLYEEEAYRTICGHIHELSDKLPKQLFIEMVNKIYRRNR